MQSFEILAEVSIGLAGFGSLAIVLSRDRATWQAADFYRIAALLSSSLGALFLALLPIGLGTSALAPEAIWRISSAALAAYLVVFLILGFHWRSRYLDRALWFGPTLFALVLGTSAATLLAQVANAAGIGMRPNPTVHFFGVVWLLAYACLMLARVFFMRPTEA